MALTRFIIAVLLAVAAAGCGQAAQVEVAGQVSLDGRPLPGGTVTFHPLDAGVPGYGTIAADGRYQLHATTETPLAPGLYRVTVIARDPAQPSPTGDLPQPGPSLAPLRYADVETSNLEFELHVGANSIDLPLHTPPSEACRGL